MAGKIAIITGASCGIGQAIAELFAEEGASVVMTALGQEELDAAVNAIKTKGHKAIGIVADVGSREDTKRVFETTIREFGDLDILINNAGIGDQVMIEETDDDLINDIMNVNFGGPLRYIREALKIFLPKNDGVIVNITSVGGGTEHSKRCQNTANGTANGGTANGVRATHFTKSTFPLYFSVCS